MLACLWAAVPPLLARRPAGLPELRYARGGRDEAELPQEPVSIAPGLLDFATKFGKPVAVEAQGPVIVTRNLGHLKPAAAFGIEVLTPAEFLARLRMSV